MIRFFLFLGFVSLFASAKTQEVNDKLKQIAINNNLAGMSVIVTHLNSINYEYYFGKADIARDIDTDENTIYRVASISKMITATALMKLFEKGEFELDDNISDYLGFEVIHPDFPNSAITFRMLLSHTSGLQDGDGYFNILNKSYRNENAPEIKELLLETGSFYTSDIWRNKEPGTYFSYSNLNYGVIATLIETISGERFDVFTTKNVLQPLEISGSFNIDDINDINNVAVLYRSSNPQADNYNGKYPEPFNDSNYIIGKNGLVFGPQGGFRGSARDLAKFMMMHYNYGKYKNEQIFDSVTIVLMHQDNWTYNGSNGNNYYNLFNSWGLGVHRVTNQNGGDVVFRGKKMLGHPGEAYGLISDMYFVEGEKTGLIFITNGLKTVGSYEWGGNSAFYLPEEQAFNVIYDEVYGKITSKRNAIKNVKLTNWIYNPTDRTIRLMKTLPVDSVIILDMSGKKIMSQKWSGSLKIPVLTDGIYIIVGFSKEKIYTNKVYIPGS